MNTKISLILLTATLLSVKTNAQTDTTNLTDREIETVTITSSTEIRKMREATMPLSVISTRPSFFYSFE